MENASAERVEHAPVNWVTRPHVGLAALHRREHRARQQRARPNHLRRGYRNGVRWWQYDPSKWLIATLSGLGLASELKRVPDMWIQRAQLAMQFKRRERALERRRPRRDEHEHFERMKARVGEEAAAFRKALEEWARVRDEWVVDRKRRLLKRGEEASFRSRLREIEHGLRLQHRRLRIMMKSLPVTAATTFAASQITLDRRL